MSASYDLYQQQRKQFLGEAAGSGTGPKPTKNNSFASYKVQFDSFINPPKPKVVQPQIKNNNLVGNLAITPDQKKLNDDQMKYLRGEEVKVTVKKPEPVKIPADKSWHEKLFSGLSRLKEKFVTSTQQAIGSGQAGIGLVQSALPFKALHSYDDNAGENIKKGLEKSKAATDRWGKYVEEKGEAKGKVAWTIEQLVGIAPSMISSFVTGTAAGIVTQNPIVGLAVGFSPSFLQQAGQSYQDAKDFGVDDDKATKLAFVGGAAVGVLEILPIGKFLSKNPNGAVIKRELTKRIIKELIEQGGTEGITEGLQTFVENVLKKSYNEDQSLWAGVPESAFIGSIAGGGSGLVKVGIGADLDPNQKKEETETEDKPKESPVVFDSEKLAKAEEMVKEAIDTKPEDRTLLQTKIVETVTTKKMSPQQVYNFVISNQLETTPFGKETIKTAVEAQKQGKTVDVKTDEDGAAVSVVMGEKSDGSVKPEELEEIKSIIKEAIAYGDEEGAKALYDGYTNDYQLPTFGELIEESNSTNQAEMDDYRDTIVNPEITQYSGIIREAVRVYRQNEAKGEDDIATITKKVTKLDEALEALRNNGMEVETMDELADISRRLERKKPVISQKVRERRQSEKDAKEYIKKRTVKFREAGDKVVLPKGLREIVTEENGVYKFGFIHNTEKSPRPGPEDTFGQKIEPDGKYIGIYSVARVESQSKYFKENDINNFETGTISFKKPYIIDNSGGLSRDWKVKLSKEFGDKKGKDLSLEMIKQGYDGIITMEDDHSSESVHFDKLLPNRESKQKNLVTVHNIKERGLLHALKMGGLPMPSLAITKTDNQYTSYGDITLIADTSLADPANRDNSVTNADAYSPRYPKITYNEKEGSSDFLKPYFEKAKAVFDDTHGSQYTLLSDFEDNGGEGIKNSYSTKEIFYADKIGQKAERREVYDYIESHESEYNKFVDNIVENITGGESIFDGYTYSGRRRYLPHTLEQVVKLMRRDMKKGEDFDYGLGSIRSKVAIKFKSLTEIGKNRDKIVSHEEMDKVKADLDVLYSEILDEASQKYTGGSDSFSVSSTFNNVLTDGIKARNIDAELKEYGFGNMDTGKIRLLLDTIRNAPTEYFESKVKRAVGLEEFKAAVLPKETDAEIIKQLKGKGLDVYQYTDDEERQQIIKRVSEEKGYAFRLKDDFKELTGKTITDEQEAKIIELNKKIFGDEDIKITAQILTPSGQKALGKYKANMIEILGGRADAVDTFYHEAVHKYLDVFTTESEQITLLVESKKKYGTNDFAEAEERLAEDFIKYAKSREGITGKIKTIFDGVLSRFNKYFGNEDMIKDFYNEILGGKEDTINATAGSELKSSQKPIGSGPVTETKLYKRVKGFLDERIRDQIGDALAPTTNNQTDTVNAIEYVRKHPKKALRIALGYGEVPAGYNGAAISSVVAFQADQSGKPIGGQILQSLSMRSRRFGQEIQYLATMGDDSPFRYISQALSLKLNRMGTSLKSEVMSDVEKMNQAKEKVARKVKERTETVKEFVNKELTKLDNQKINMAQSIIDAITCK